MKCSIKKKDYFKIYKMTENVFPLGDFDCGSLCNSICCVVENKEKDNRLLEMVLYLLPGEEELLEEDDWFEMYYETTEECEYPDSWDGNVYYIKCTNPPHCNRKYRPIQCRSFPLSPHLDSDNKLHLIYDEDDMTYKCPLISEKIELDDKFVKTIFKMWEKLIQDKLIFDLVKMDSDNREKNNIDYVRVI